MKNISKSARLGICDRWVAKTIWTRDISGMAAVEFALLVPPLFLILAGTADFGGALYDKFILDSAVSAAANYAIVNAASVSSTGGSGLATNLASIIMSAHTTNYATGTIIVNNGPSATFSGGAVTSGGTASNADLYYCPTGSGASVAWGSAVTYGASCTGGGTAGKFVTIVANKTYTPIFSSYGVIKNGAISVSAVVETQ